jgi:hypothetical protein
MWTSRSNLRRALHVTGAIMAIALTSPVGAQQILDVERVAICKDDGSECNRIGADYSVVGGFWERVAGIRLNVTTRTFNSTEFWSMGDGDAARAKVRDFLLAQPSPDPAGPAGFRTSPIRLWYSSSGLFIASNGVIDGNRSWVSSSLSDDFQSVFTAQVLGVNLGLSLVQPFTLPGENLMQVRFSSPNLDNLSLTEAQLGVVANSRFLRTATPVAVPEPSTALLVASALSALLWRNTSRRRA